MRISLFWLLVWLCPFSAFAQSLDQEQQAIETELAKLDMQRAALLQQLEDVKLRSIQTELQAIGLPGTDVIMHSALALEYSEAHEQARWVAHIILPDIIDGNVSRTNDFREDPLVTTGTAVEADYFLKYLQPDSSYTYDGFGYDRGHLAPSADFRWSQQALSESYFYSNMSPQLAVFNREGWAELEGLLRAYIYEHPDTKLYVVTGPVLEDNLPTIERSVNKLAIPKAFFKVALDVKNGRGIGFLVPHGALDYPLEHYAVSIDAVEAATGLDFFAKLDDSKETPWEATLDKSLWLPELAKGDVEPLIQPDLPANHFNTIVGGRYAGKGDAVTVCGTVVSTRYSRAGNLWLNLDKQFPNQIFSIFIRKKDLVNFSFDPQKAWEGQQLCFKGKVEEFNGTPTINLTREQEVSDLPR